MGVFRAHLAAIGCKGLMSDYALRYPHYSLPLFMLLANGWRISLDFYVRSQLEWPASVCLEGI